MSSIDRKPHCLIREKTLAMPRHILFFDTETEQVETPEGNIEQRFKLGWACYWRRAYGRNLEKKVWHFFTSPESFWLFLGSNLERKQKLWVISHNLNFDFTIVDGWRNLHDTGFKLKFFHNNGTTTIISVRGKYGSILFVDFLNWFAESLASIGNRIGIPKLTIDFDTADDDFLSTYCKRDVEILVAAFADFIRFLESNSISRLCYTIGSTAMAAYLLNHYDYKIYIHNNSEAIDLERAAYRGGRCECFYLGELKNETYHILDVNSLYSTVMYHGVFPVRYISYIPSCTIDVLEQNLKDRAVIAKVLIEMDEPAYAVRRERTIFPTGRFWVTLTTPELVYALNHDHIIDVDRAVVYEHEPIFRSYIERFFLLRLSLKDSGSESYEAITKLLLNSLYGKFGQKAEVWKKIGDCPDEPDRVELCFATDSHRVGKIRYLLGEIFELTGYEECFNSFPAIAATVAAYARMYLYKLMKLAGSGNYFYCDTDSLIVNAAGFENLKSVCNPVNLGCLKEVETVDWIDIRGLKDYSTASKTVIKGIRKNAVVIRDGVYRQEVWPSLKGILRTGQTDTYIVKKVTKILDRRYSKGTVLKSGTVVPFSLSEDYLPCLWLE